MFQILESAPDRLILRIGVQPFETSTIILDKSTGRARFERTMFFWKLRPIDLALEEIAAITIAAHEKAANRKRTKRDNPTVQLKSGQPFRLSDPGDTKSAIEAVRQMSTFLGQAEPETNAKPAAGPAGTEPAGLAGTAPAADQPDTAATVTAGVEPSAPHGVAAADPANLAPPTAPTDPVSVDPPTHPPSDATTSEQPSQARAPDLPADAPPSGQPSQAKPPALPADAPPSGQPSQARPPDLPTDAPTSGQPSQARPPALPTDAPPSRMVLWTGLGVSLLCALALLGFGVAWATNRLTLPECGDEITRDMLISRFEGKKIKVERLSDLKTISSTKAERTCEGRADIPGGIFNLEFRIDWSGWSRRVTIVRADAEVKIDTARLEEVRKAADDFLAFARDSYVTGRAPRQSEPPIRELLDKVFDLSELDGTPLTVSDVTKALDWFVAGDRVGTVYILAGTGIDDINKLTNDASIQRRTHRNVAEFAAEFARYLDFQVKLAGIMMEAEINRAAKASPDVLNRPEVRREIADVRSTLAETLTGTLTTLAYDGLSDGWRRDRLKLMIEVAPKASQFLFADQARAVREHALRVATYQRDRAVEQDVRSFADRIAGR
jgi:hypothetical protein